MNGLQEDHLLACQGFSDVVAKAQGKWDQPSPCEEWDASGVLEHVIGFHDALLLKPNDYKPDRQNKDPQSRWEVTVEALNQLFADEVKGNDVAFGLIKSLTVEVLVHTWDLGKAIDVPIVLNERLCIEGLERTEKNRADIDGSGMFAHDFGVLDSEPLTDRLVGALGRDPKWSKN